jgi:hypothetical protein
VKHFLKVVCDTQCVFCARHAVGARCVSPRQGTASISASYGLNGISIPALFETDSEDALTGREQTSVGFLKSV